MFKATTGPAVTGQRAARVAHTAEPIPRQPRRDDSAADVRSLVQLGRADPPPVPSIRPFLEPDLPPVEDADD